MAHTKGGLQPTDDKKLRRLVLQLQEKNTANKPMILEAEASPAEPSDESRVPAPTPFLKRETIRVTRLTQGHCW